MYIVQSACLRNLYKRWQELASQDQIEFVDKVFLMCEANYEAGGDTVVECYGPTDILQEFKCLADARELCRLHTQAATEARWGEDSDPEVNRPAWM